MANVNNSTLKTLKCSFDRSDVLLKSSPSWIRHFDLIKSGDKFTHGQINRDGKWAKNVYATQQSPLIHCRDAVVVNKWTHVAMTWGRTQGTVRLFMNGEMNVSKNVTSNSKDFMNSGHSVFDIGLKRDSRTTAHAYFSDLMVFSRELRFSPIKNVNEIKEYLVLKHPLSKDSVGTVGVS